MFKSLFRDVRVVLVAVLLSSAIVAAPAMAAYDALNADKVDGKSAVGAGASINQRKGKLVATNSKGFLPNNIIKTAPNAAKLGGLPGSAFLHAEATTGEIQTGGWALSSSASLTNAVTYVAFREELAQDLGATDFAVLMPGVASTADCPGPGMVAKDGFLCIYVEVADSASNAWAGSVIDAGNPGVDVGGFLLHLDFSQGGRAYGSFAVRNP
jgi:hypothetical protein